MLQMRDVLELNGELEQLSKSINIQNHMILDLQSKTDHIENKVSEQRQKMSVIDVRSMHLEEASRIFQRSISRDLGQLCDEVTQSHAGLMETIKAFQDMMCGKLGQEEIFRAEK